MDAIVGESYVSTTHSDRNNTALDEGGSSDKNIRKNTKSTGRRQPETTYGVSENEIDKKVENSIHCVCVFHSSSSFLFFLYQTREWMRDSQMLSMITKR